MLGGCGPIGVAAGPWIDPASRVQYVKAGSTDKRLINDGVACGMAYVFGSLIYRDDQIVEVDKCMRRKGYEPVPPGRDSDRRIWTLE